MNLFTTIHVFLYRISEGSIGGRFRGAPVALLTTTGSKTGKKRTTPVLYIEENKNVVLVASNGGRPRDPMWWSNLRKNPDAEVQLKKEMRKMRARRASLDEKSRLWPLLTKMYPTYDDYKKKTSRDIPVVILELRN